MSDCSKGYDKSFELVRQEFIDNGPYDGVLAFSQGAAFLSLLCVEVEKGNSDIKFQFAILVAGFKSLINLHQPLYEHRVQMPTLHVFGDTDSVIPKGELFSIILLEIFVSKI